MLRLFAMLMLPGAVPEMVGWSAPPSMSLEAKRVPPRVSVPAPRTKPGLAVVPPGLAKVMLPLRVLFPTSVRVEPAPLRVMLEAVAIWPAEERVTFPPLSERSPGMATTEVPLALGVLRVSRPPEV